MKQSRKPRGRNRRWVQIEDEQDDDATGLVEKNPLVPGIIEFLPRGKSGKETRYLMS